MNLEEIYILNPAYALKRDSKRVVLTAYEKVGRQPDRIPYDDSIIFLLHPINAQMLAFFDGTRTLSACITAMAAYFGLAEEEIREIVSKFIENEDRLHIRWKDQFINFPVNLLVPAGRLKRRETYRPEQFAFDGEIDLFYSRMYSPVNLTWEMTMRCYTDCTYCYADRSRAGNETLMPLEQALGLIRECRSMGIVNLSINGGEVLMHPHWRELFGEMSLNGYNSLISTKRPIDEDSLRFLKEIGMMNVQLSLDSLDPATLHRMVRSGSGYVEAMKETMQRLDEMGFDWQVHTILTRYNADLDTQIKPMVEYLLPYRNLRSYRVDTAGYSLYKSPEHYNEIKIPLADYNRIASYIREMARNHTHIEIGIGEPDTKDERPQAEKESAFRSRALCTGNLSTMVVLPDGQVTICEELYWHPRFLIGDLREQSIQQIWDSDKARQLFYLSREAVGRQSACAECDAYSTCRGYPGTCWKMTLAAYGNDRWDYPDPRCPYAPEPAHACYLA